jgi:outer membrane protein assembly factor BamC
MTKSPVAAARGLLWPLVAGIALALAGCSTIDLVTEQGKIEYKSAGKRPDLDVPPDLVKPRGDDRYSIPERPQGEKTLSGYQTARATERPATEAAVLPPVEGMRIERAGTQRWLVVNQPAEKLWPIVREFWQESGFLIQVEVPAAGLMETDWAENRAKIPQDIIRRTVGKVFENLYSTGERDKFRTRFEPVPGGTEIYISHRGMVEVLTGSSSIDKDSSVWQARPNDPELEAEFLRRLMIKLGADQERAETLVASAAQPARESTRIVQTPSGATELEIREGFDRAWRRVGLALDRGGFTVEDRDRSQGAYFVRYIDPEVAGAKKPGFFGRLFSSKPPESKQQYQVKLAAEGELTRLSVLSREGQPLASEIDRGTAQKIVALLREQLQQ